MVAFFPAMLYSRPLLFPDHVAFAGIDTVTKLNDLPLIVVLADVGKVTTSLPSTLVNVG